MSCRRQQHLPCSIINSFIPFAFFYEIPLATMPDFLHHTPRFPPPHPRFPPPHPRFPPPHTYISSTTNPDFLHHTPIFPPPHTHISSTTPQISSTTHLYFLHHKPRFPPTFPLWSMVCQQNQWAIAASELWYSFMLQLTLFFNGWFDCKTPPVRWLKQFIGKSSMSFWFSLKILFLAKSTPNNI